MKGLIFEELDDLIHVHRRDPAFRITDIDRIAIGPELLPELGLLVHLEPGRDRPVRLAQGLGS